MNPGLIKIKTFYYAFLQSIQHLSSIKFKKYEIIDPVPDYHFLFIVEFSFQNQQLRKTLSTLNP